ncbi:MAG: RagB/SusD family nutrient uptake outer membrane protein [Flavisolibacter sp.]
MKRLIIIGVSSFLLINLWSCKKGYLDQVPQDRTTIEQVFAHKNTVDNFLANVYSYVRDESDQRFIGGTHEGGPWTGASDEAEYDWSFVGSNYMNVGSWGPTSGFVNDFWGNYYTAIRSATYFMAHVGECKEITDQANGSQLLARYIAEARALRAYYYYNLVKIFGPVVIIGDNAIAPDASLPSVQLARSPFDSCVAYISTEFDKAATDLPDVPANPSVDNGRMTKSVVMAYKAELLLAAASDLFNGNTDYASLKNQNGTSLISQQKDPGKWSAAAAAAKAFIDKYVPGTFDLYKVTDGAGNIDPYLSCRNVMYTDWNKEWIFAIVGCNPTTRQYEETPYHAGKDGSIRGSGGLGATQEMVDAYFMDNGLSITDPGSGYVENGFSTTSGKYTTAGTYNMYCNREPRFYVGITYNGSTWLNTTSSSGTVTTETFYNGNSGKRVGGNDYSPTGYIVRKNIPIGDWRVGNRAWLLLRLANIYLDYAEALNESSPGNADIAKYVNLIRERAGLPDLAAGLSQEAMRTAIRKERRVELAFENVRYFDTRRWKIAEQTDGGPFYGMDINSGNSLSDLSFYKRTVFENRVFDKKDYLWPIPQAELDVDKNLVQNTGW